MVDVSEPMPEESGTDITETEILAKLLEKRNIELHTTIHNPHGMTAVDQGLALIKLEFGADAHKFAKVWVDFFRINMVAEDGNRATGVMNAVAAKIEERKAKSRLEKELGDLNR